MFINPRYYRFGSAALLIAAAAVSLTGCGSSSSGGGSSTITPDNISTVTLTGTVTTSGSTPVSGWLVAFNLDNVDGYTTTTNSSGQYSITIPESSTPIADYLTVADTSGNIWYDGPVSAGAANATANVTLPASDTVSGEVNLSTNTPASGYTVVFKSGNSIKEPATTGTPPGTGYTLDVFYRATTNSTTSPTNYSLSIPTQLNVEGTTQNVTTSAGTIYVVDSNYVQWVTATTTPAPLPSTYTYSPKLSATAVTANGVVAKPSGSQSLKAQVKANLLALLASTAGSTP